jgi:hypothetical protein
MCDSGWESEVVDLIADTGIEQDPRSDWDRQKLLPEV